jgi:hypothetical protein
VHGAGGGRGSKSRRRPVALAAGCALAVVACGSSSKPRNTTGSNGSAQAVAYADCMRSHGVQNFPDASSGGGLAIPSTINTQSPTYIRARGACATLQPGPIVPRLPSERQERQLVAGARCMRRYGVSVADPTFQGPYITLGVPDEATMQSPAFRRAEKACDYPVPKH